MSEPHSETGRYFELIERGDVRELRRLVTESPALLQARTAPSYAPGRQIACTGLHAAVYAGKPEAARVLVEAGIDIDARSNEGRTALHESIELGQCEIEEMLLEHGAHVDICTAAILGKIDRLRELLDEDPDLANERSTGLSPLGWASFGNQVETATELLERGALMDDGELLCAALVEHVEVGALLLDRGADPNAIHEEAGANALHAAATMRYGHDSRAFVRMLLDRGADPGLPTPSGKTADRIADERAREDEHDRPFKDIAVMSREAARKR